MKFFYADALDLVDPRFDFLAEESPPDRIPQRDDVYAHELMAPDSPYDGLLVSKFLFDLDKGQGRYSQAQKFRFMREGVHRFMRFPPSEDFDRSQWPVLGDCGAFNYRDEPEPPYSVDDVIEFYELCGFTHGVSVDHMIGAYDASLDQPKLLGPAVPEDYQYRFDLTLELAAEFMARCQSGNLGFQPIGIAQGWSPRSYQRAVEQLIKIGFDYIALGGLVPLKTPDILQVLESVKQVTGGNVRLHLFGITRLENLEAYSDAGVVSLDSASPMLQAFKDSKNNYYSNAGHYTAIRVPQAHKYPKLIRAIRSGKIEQAEAQRLEREALEGLRAYGKGEGSADEILRTLRAYEALYGGKSRWPAVRRTLVERPWEKCDCAVCRALGIEVVIFRGANRNRRRGFHNLWHMQKTLHQYRSSLEGEA
jgi:hypothetical protein